MCHGHQPADDHRTALSQQMHICNKKSWNGVYKGNTFSLSCRQDNMAKANVNTNKQSRHGNVSADTHRQSETTQPAPLTTRLPNREAKHSVFAALPALPRKSCGDRFTIVGRGGALDCPCPFSSATQRQLSPCLSSDRAPPLTQPGPASGITTQARLIAVSTGTGGSQHLLLDIS